MQAICWKQNVCFQKPAHTHIFAFVPVASLLSVPELLFISSSSSTVKTYFRSKVKPMKSFMPSWFPTPVTVQQAFQASPSRKPVSFWGQWPARQAPSPLRPPASYLHRSYHLLRASCFILSVLWVLFHSWPYRHSALFSPLLTVA